MNSIPKARSISPLTQAKTTGTAWYRLPAAISNPNFITIAAFWAIGLLTMLNVMLRFPDLGSLIERYNQF
jgi:hypothetical protein